MGNRSDHLTFDEILREKGIIELGEYDCDQVHEKMDLGEGSHSRNSPHHSEEGIRRWVNGGHDSFWDSLFGDAWGHRYGEFIRVALGHIVLDEYWTKYTMNTDPQRDRDEVFEMAYRTFVNRGYDKARFRRREG
jgi:hypothetical protein